MAITTVEKIIETYNDSVESIYEAYKLAQARDLNGAMKKITASSTLVYQSIEWFLKYYLSPIFSDPALHRQEMRIIEASSFKDKLELFKHNSSPTVSSVGLNLQAILALKQTVRNDPEHSGLIPHFDSLVIVIKETRKLLTNYLDVRRIQIKELVEIENITIEQTNEWRMLLGHCNNFDTSANYILVTGPFSGQADVQKPLGLIEWNAIFDFNNESEISGLFKVASPQIQAKRPIHRLTFNDNISPIFSEHSTYWIFSNGLNGRNGSSFETFREWNRHYSNYISKVIEKLQQTLSNKPTIVVIAFESSNHVTELVKLFYNQFGISIKFVFAVPDLALFKFTSDEYGGAEVPISLHQMAEGLLQIKNFFNPVIDTDEYIIPHKDHSFVSISENDFKWIEEDMELLHHNILDRDFAAEDTQERVRFYKGGMISWKGLQLNYDIHRDRTSIIESKIERKMKEREIGQISILHYPGIGGTTMSRRVAWNARKKYPTAMLKGCRPVETIDRIYKIFQSSALPPLIIVDGSRINNEVLLRLYAEGEARSFPIIFLYVQRKVAEGKLQENEVYVSDVLTDLEVNSFVSMYSELAPDRKGQLMAISKSKEKKERHPLFIGLSAFEKNFTGLKEFVEKAHAHGSSIQNQMIAFISFCDVYAQKSLSAQAFTGLLMLLESAVVRLPAHLSPELLYLIINDRELDWRPLHYLVGKEFLQQHLGPGADTQLMRHGLADISVEFIDLLSKRSFTPSREELEMIGRLFIDRNTEDSIDGEEDAKFSKLISEGLLDDNARLRVFRKLTECFPTKPHFWSHLARFYNMILRDYPNALNAIDHALELDIAEHGQDGTLYHIKGMVFRNMASALMETCRGNKALSKEELLKVQKLIESAGEQFEITREYNKESDYGYISHIDTIIRYIDFKFSVSTYTERADFLTHMNGYDLELFSTAEQLLEELGSKMNYDTKNFYYTRSQSKVAAYFSNYSAIIQGWNNLLDPSKNVNKSVVRRLLVHAYVGRVSGWENLDQRDIDRILTLMEENISADPGDKQNVFLWFMTARNSNRVVITDAIDKLSRWRTIDASVDASFYLAILHAIQAIAGNSTSKIRAEELLTETSLKSRLFPNRNFPGEWFGKGTQLGKIIRRDKVISWSATNEMQFDLELLEEVTGKVAEIRGPESGQVELSCGLRAFFIPARVEGGLMSRDKDLNTDVRFLLAFSYDGLRAYRVRRVSA